MKMVKCLLLGAAAGFVAVSGAQAADMPVKAKPVQYVKICNLYGDGFYYIPGTDTCLKLGGYVRVQVDFYGAGNGGIPVGNGPMIGQGRYDRVDTNDINYRVRGVMTLDVRQQTEYGTLRNYIRAGWDQTTPPATGAGTTVLAYFDRGFIQFAGFTVGRAQSFFDIFTFGGQWSYLNVRTAGDNGATGTTMFGYTAQLGNGVSASLSAEDPIVHNKAGTFDASAAGFFAAPLSAALNDNAFTAQGTAAQFGFRTPDVVANLRVDQAWGYAGVSAALHDASGGYYLNPNGVNNGHPADKLGWAAAAGFQLNLPNKDGFGMNAVYAKGATGYATNAGNWQHFNASTSVGVAWGSDGIFDTGTDIELTEAWSVNIGYQHIWANPKWRTSLYGGYVNIHYNDTAKTIINSHQTTGAGGFRCSPVVGTLTFTGLVPQAGNSCNPDYSFYQIGTRTQWNPVRQLDIGLDVFYTHLNTAYKGPATHPATGARPAVNLIDDQNIWAALFRWQRNFYP